MKIQKKLEIGKELQIVAKGHKPTYQKGINVATTGASLVTPDLLKEVLSADWAEGTIFELCRKLPVSTDHNSIKIPVAQEVTRSVAAGILGGLTSSVVAEEAPITLSFPTFQSDTLTLNKNALMVIATDEILSDATYLAKYLHDSLAQGLKFYIDNFILYGDGTTCNGICNSGNRSTGTVTTNTTLALSDLRAMVKKYYGNPEGVWCMNQSQWNQVVDLVNADNAYQAIKWHHSEESKEELTPYLYGYRVIRKDNMNLNDIVLGHFKQYSVAMIDPRTDISSELYFASYQSAFRMLYRINGMPAWIGGVTLEDGSTVYPFVYGTH